MYSSSINIYNLIQTNNDLADAINEYYYGSNFDKCSKRFTLFGEYIETLNDLNQEDGILVVGKAFLGLATTSEVSYANTIKYFTNMILNSGVTTDEKNAVSVAFADYIKARIAEENM